MPSGAWSDAMTAVALADVFGNHHGLGTGDWIVMGLGMLVLWGALIALFVWAVGGGLTRREATPREILRRRLAAGSITVEEYEQRRAALENTGPSGDEQDVGPPTPGAA